MGSCSFCLSHNSKRGIEQIVGKMLTSNREEEDEFFESAEFLVSEEFIKEKEEELDYEIWRNEPQSVIKRKERFLSRMGFAEFASSRAVQDDRDNGLERLTELSGAVQSSDIYNGQAYGNEEDNQENSSNEEIFNGEETKECESFDVDKRRIKQWWKILVDYTKERAKSSSSQSKTTIENSKKGRVKVRQKKTKFAELTGLYVRQEFQAHEGFIWGMKFSPDGRYLASGGEDGVVRIWRVELDDFSGRASLNDSCFDEMSREGSNFLAKPLARAALLLPKKLFRIKESPIQEFHGHSSDVLDLAWSNSNCLLSSSMDKTVRLWQVGCDRCLNIFHHPNYVTCIQFNPVDENHFISGSVDGKVRIWGVAEKRVVDWAEVRDVITAISYQPNGKGFVVGSVFGTCSLYEASGEHCWLAAQIHVEGRKKASGKRITGIQVFSQDNFKRVMITSEDSKLRIYDIDALKLVLKYKGPQNSGSQMSASFTASGKHIVSIGEDSRVYFWNYDGITHLSPKEPKSIQSCENFSSEGVSVAAPWPGSGSGKSGGMDSFLNPPEILPSPRDSEGFSFVSWFNADKASATWPEEKLGLQGMPYLGKNGNLVAPATWGLVIVTASIDGVMRTFHNYGLPIRV